MIPGQRDHVFLLNAASCICAPVVPGLLPCLQVHIMDQPELDKGEGPIGVVVAPTRELAEQIHKEARRFSRAYSELTRVVNVFERVR
jgi:hypothetical protein